MTVSFDFRFLPNFSRHLSFSVYDVSICVLSHVLVSRWTLRNKKCMRERAYSIPEYGLSPYCFCRKRGRKPRGGGGGTSYDGLYVEVPLQVNGMVGILLVEVYRRLRKSVIWVCERAQKGYQMNFIGLLSREKVLFL